MDDRLIVAGKISLDDARSKICAYAIWTDHGIEPRLKSSEEVARYLISKGVNPDNLARKCRDYKAPIPFFQNLMGESWTTHGDIKTTVVERRSGESVRDLNRSGQIHSIRYSEIFRYACLARDRAIAEMSYIEFLLAITLGIASMEGTVQYQVEAWNRAHPENQLIGNKENKVRFEEKLTNWIPQMTGKSIDKSQSFWGDFKEFERLRDDQLVHPKQGYIAVENNELGRLLDKFKNGIGAMTVEIHKALLVLIPNVVIDAMHYPKISLAHQ